MTRTRGKVFYTGCTLFISRVVSMLHLRRWCGAVWVIFIGSFDHFFNWDPIGSTPRGLLFSATSTMFTIHVGLLHRRVNGFTIVCGSRLFRLVHHLLNTLSQMLLRGLSRRLHLTIHPAQRGLNTLWGDTAKIRKRDWIHGLLIIGFVCFVPFF